MYSLILFILLCLSTINSLRPIKKYIALVGNDYTNSSNIIGKTIQGTLISLNENDLIRTKNIIHYEEDSQVKTTDYIEQKLTNQWNLDQLDSFNSTYNNRYRYYNKGSGVNIYIVDSGIFPNVDISERIDYKRGVDMTPEIQRMHLDCLGHGTHVASIAAGKISGVAKNATLISVKVFDCEGKASMSVIIRSIEWIKNQLRPNEKCVINMSLEGPSSYGLINIIKSINSKCIVVVAAGNGGNDSCFSSPSNSKDVITVGAININNQVANYSNYGNCIKIFAPGDSIYAANNVVKGFTKKSGTSMASPIVSGICALEYEKIDYSSTSIEQLKQKVISMAVKGVIFTDITRKGPDLIAKSVISEDFFDCLKIRTKKRCKAQNKCFFKKTMCYNKLFL